MTWKVTFSKNFTCENPIFIEGLPGIGNVGKIVIDYLISLTKAKKVATLFSYDMPNSVFVNEKNLITLPSIELYHFKLKKQDFLFLTGDAQPSNERASYELTDLLLDIVEKFKGKQVITLGGIGLAEIPNEPLIYVTGNNKNFIKEFKEVGANPNLFGIVGPIIGVSGLMLGLSKPRKIQAVSILGETFGHPMYIGLKESKKILQLLDKKYNFKLDLKELDEEINLIEQELNVEDESTKKPSKKLGKLKKYQELGYIG
ncbi:MAG: PAC2 family protein [Candidatus Woesearchaeota archaeon]